MFIVARSDTRSLRGPRDSISARVSRPTSVPRERSPGRRPRRRPASGVLRVDRTVSESSVMGVGGSRMSTVMSSVPTSSGGEIACWYPIRATPSM
ncbi:MAG: hypothetical protein F4238_14625 [Gemmatimonadetes bacterium]|nr:hypothetical protein [Gemmatimonadota bacterium]